MYRCATYESRHGTTGRLRERFKCHTAETEGLREEGFEVGEHGRFGWAVYFTQVK